MALQFSTAVRNAMLDVIESTTGVSAKLRILTGTPPVNCAAAQSGTLLVEITLPSDWMQAASSGTKQLSGTWQAVATGSGTAGYYRIVDNSGTTCHEQGTVTNTGGGGDMTVDNTNIAANQTITVTTKTLTAPNP